MSEMVTKLQVNQDYNNYIKCGEILKSPLSNYENSIILKCFECNEVHYILESFVNHIGNHFKDILSADEEIGKTQYENVHEDEMESEGIGIDNPSIKVEDMEDPLIPVKCEIYEVKSNKKDNQNTDESENFIYDYDIEHCNEFEDVFDSPDEFQASDLDTDGGEEEEEIIKKFSNKRRIKLSPVVNEFMQTKSNVSTLIDFYKNQPNLWKKDSPFYRLKDKRKQFLEEITQDLNKKQNLKLTWNQTAEIISHICGKHRDDLKRLQGNKTKIKKSYKKQGKHEKRVEKKYKCSWYFEQLNFLRSKVIIRLQKLDSNVPDLTSEQIIKILEIYQRFPHLWNTYLIENICSNKRHDAHIEMLKVLEADMNLKISVNALEEYIRTIHNYFSREKRYKLDFSKQKELQNATEMDTSNYYVHMSFLEDHEGPFSCSECSGTYTKPLCFRVHKSQHDGSIPLTCSQCNQEFKSVASYTTHAKRHLEDLQFICKECNMKFLRHSDLKIHLLTHTDARPYCCEICGASYRQANSFKKHQRRHENRFSHTCHICSKGYYSKYRYVDHMNSHMNIRSHICNVCGKAFITSRALKTHSVTHEDARNHACNLCGKTFKLKIGVLQHMRTHGSKVENDDKKKLNLK